MTRRRYLPDRDEDPELPPVRNRSRRTRWLLLAGIAGVVAIGFAGVGVLLPAARIHLPFANNGPRGPGWGVAAASPTATSADVSATSSPTESAATPDPSASPPEPTPGDMPALPVEPGMGGPDAAGGAAPSPPSPAPPPAGEPTPTPGTSYRTSAFDVPSGRTRPPLVHGELIWYNRSVGVSAAIWSTSPCAAAVFTGYAGGTQVARIATAYRCGTVTVSQNLNGRTIPGGITQVIIDLYVNGTRVGRDSCMRRTAVCTRA